MPGAGATPHHITVPRTARFWTLEPGGDVAQGTLYALHGYGQLAEYFIRKFQPVADAGWRVIAPEGAHRFYLQGFSGRVGASWMTKEDRLSDIADYVAFLDQLRQGEGPARSPGPSVLLGFSQGVATALRWLALGGDGAGSWDGVIAHSGIIPPDLPKEQGLLSNAPPLLLIAGTADEYIDQLDRRFDDTEAEWKRLGGPAEGVTRHVFDGGHTVHAPSVLAALEHMQAGG